MKSARQQETKRTVVWTRTSFTARAAKKPVGKPIVPIPPPPKDQMAA